MPPLHTSKLFTPEEIFLTNLLIIIGLDDTLNSKFEFDLHNTHDMIYGVFAAGSLKSETLL